MWLELKLFALTSNQWSFIGAHSHSSFLQPNQVAFMPACLPPGKKKMKMKKKKKEVTAARQMRLLTLMSMSASLLFSGFRGRPGRLGMLPLDMSVVCSGGG